MSVTTFTDSPGSEPRRTDAQGSTNGRLQLARLFRLVLILQSERFPNAKDLAERCEVSRRTIYRDLELLTDSGFPVRYRRERQGYQLSKGVVLPPTTLVETEALALLVLARQWGWGDGLGLQRHAWEGAVKLIQSLPQELRERVLASAEPFQSERLALTLDPTRQAVIDAILTAILQLKQVRVWYTTKTDSNEQCTKFSLYRLLLHDRTWHMVGRSSVDRKIVVIGVPWISKAVATDDLYSVPPRFNLERFLGQAWGVERSPIRHRVCLRFSARVAPSLNDTLWHRSQRKTPLSDSRLDLSFEVDGLDEIAGWVLGFGEDVEVIEPEALREKIFETCSEMARRHAPSRSTQQPTRIGRG